MVVTPTANKFFNFSADTHTVKNPAWLLDNPDFVQRNDPATGIRGFYTLDSLNHDERAAYEAFFGLLKVNVPHYLLLASYDANYVYQWATFPQLIRDGEKVFLMVGASDEQHQAIKVPLTKKELKSEDTETELAYYLGKTRLYLGSLMGQNDAKYPIFYIKGNGYNFYFWAKLQSEVAYETVDYAFSIGDLEELIVSPFGSGAKFQTMFAPSFTQGLFPNSGVLLVLENLEYVEAERANRITGEKFTTKQVKAKLVASSHPDLIVYDWGSESDRQQLMLQDITVMTFPDNSYCTPMLQVKANGYQPIKRLFLHVTGMKSNKPEQSPVNVGAVDIRYLPPLTKNLFAPVLNQFQGVMSVSSTTSLTEEIDDVSAQSVPHFSIDIEDF